MDNHLQYLPPAPPSAPLPISVLLPPAAPPPTVPSIRLSALRRAMDRIPDQKIDVLLLHDGAPPFTIYGLASWQVQQYISWDLLHAVLGDDATAPQLEGDQQLVQQGGKMGFING